MFLLSPELIRAITIVKDVFILCYVVKITISIINNNSKIAEIIHINELVLREIRKSNNSMHDLSEKLHLVYTKIHSYDIQSMKVRTQKVKVTK